MKNAALPAIFLLPILFLSCLLRPRPETPLPGFPEKTAAEQGEPVFKPMPRIADHEDSAAGKGIPEWVSCYFTETEAGLEKMAEYEGKYVFIGENRGRNPGALAQWRTAFSPFQDFAQLAAARIEARLVKGAAGHYPDNVYGPFFEAMVKKAYDAKYQGVQKEKAFWVHLVPQPAPPAGPDEEGTGAGEEAESPVYVFLILFSIDRPAFEAQVKGVFDAAKTGLSLTRSQEAAVNRVYENFFDDTF
ncbi:MAG: hypothetical protein LBH26_07445 [Treponema sp.]|jgi:hypothetical protein|nr:hypothetical protein [Treponema sp.]